MDALPSTIVAAPEHCWHLRHPDRAMSRRIKEGILAFSTLELAKAYIDKAIGYEVRVVGMPWKDFAEGARNDDTTHAVLDIEEGKPLKLVPLT